MDDRVDSSLSERVAKLENSVREIQRSIDRLNASLRQARQAAPAGISQAAEPPRTFVKKTVESNATVTPKTAPAAPIPARPAKKPFELPEHMRKTEYWLNRIGIGLLLFAVVFLFKYSIDKGWLTPAIRILFGLGLGTALLIIGFRTSGKKRHFGQVLTGGAIATYYITGFAAFQKFSLVSYPVAFAFMVAVTIIAFIISLRQDQAIFSLIGTIGGLGTPFLLYTDAASIPGLMLYTCLILAGTGAVYFFRGWCTLLWLSILGGWTIFLVSLIDGILPGPNPVLSDQWALQIGVLFGWLMFWAVPVVRDVVSASNSARWRLSTLGFGGESVSRDIRIILDHHVFLATILVPLVTLGISVAIWPDLMENTWGWITVVAAAVFGFVFWGLNGREKFKNLAITHAIMGLMFFTVGLSLLLDGDTLLIAIAAEATAMHLVARMTSQKAINICAHILFIVIGLWLTDRLHLSDITILAEPVEGIPIINARALTDLLVIGLGFFMSVRLRSIFEKRTYFIVASAIFAIWLCRELEGNVLFLSLTAEAVALHALALWKKDRAITATAHAFFGALGIWLAVRLFNPHTDETAILNAHALINLFVILTAAGVVRLLESGREWFLYLLIAHIAFLGWFLSELAPLDNGQGFITIAWGVYSAVLLVAGLIKDYHRLRTVSMITLFIVVAKLFLVDLANLEVLWRILLFMGFGGLFLFLSYYFQDLWKAKQKSADQPE